VRGGQERAGGQESRHAAGDLRHHVGRGAEPARDEELARLHRGGQQRVDHHHAPETPGQGSARPPAPHHQHPERHAQQQVGGDVREREPARDRMGEEAREGVGIVAEVEREERAVGQEDQVEQQEDGGEAARVHRARA
jgi:hypothetical protein